ncbi:MAG: histidine phosphatase family protein [Desulfatitalea sp.]|nr:histidine phosphatase family protein [Desulfatitalea sp.]NNK00510.1 histidine phosphatase family protein [Desulfatitalea sp.]
MAPTRVYMVRHGEVHNPRRILYGRLPRFRLSDNGRRQAAETARYFSDKPIEAVFSSPMLRARQTALAILKFHPGLKLHISRRINEVNTACEGMPSVQIDRRDGDIYTGQDACYEQPDDLFRRTAAFLLMARLNHPGGQVVAVTHGDVVTFSVLWAKGWPLIPKNKTRLRQAGFPTGYPAHASVTTLIFQTADDDERPEVDYVQPWK